MARKMKLAAYDEFGNEVNGVSLSVTESQWNAMSRDEQAEVEKKTL
nr:hypothetical protein [Providencia rettgeri]